MTTVKSITRLNEACAFQLETLRMAIKTAQHVDAAPDIQRDRVLWILRAQSAQYKASRHYTFAMWCQQLHSRAVHSGSIKSLLRTLKSETSEPPLSNRGVNSIEQ